MKRCISLEIIKEIQRELNTRKRVYPNWILQERIKENIANKRIKILEQVLEDYKQKQISETKQATLFEEA